ncbi:MAG TPA: ATP-binding protein [Gaiellaceae bacterium]
MSGFWAAAVLASLSILENGARRCIHRFGRLSQLLSFDELTVVAAPVVASPAAIVIALPLASIAGNLITRRPPSRLVWNAVASALQSMIAMLVFVGLGGARDGSGRSLFAALAAGVAFLAANYVLFSLFLAKLGGRRLRDVLPDSVRDDARHAAGILPIGLLGAAALAHAVWVLPALLLAVVAFERGLEGYIRARAEQHRLQSLLAASSDGIFALDGAGRVTSWNPAMEALLGVDAATATGARFQEVAAGVLWADQIEALLDPDASTLELADVVDALGARRTLRVARSPLPADGAMFTVSDSTALVASLEVLRASRDRLGLALRSASAALWEWDAEAQTFTWSENLGPVVAGAGAFADALGLLPDDAIAVARANDAALASGEPYEVEVRAAGPDGEPRWLRLRADVIRGRGRRLLRGISQDISEIRRREDERRELAAASLRATTQAADAEQRLQRMLEQMNDGFYAIDRDWRFVYVNDRGAGLLGRSAAELTGASAHRYARLGPELAAACVRAMEQRTVVRVEDEAFEPGRWFELTVHPVPEGIWVFTRETTEERHLSEQLRHAQKLEAVGQLAGGVAHDFNNLLTVINGYSSLALARALEVDPLLARRVEQVLAAGQRAATLTEQLLAFSRQQVLRDRVVDVNAAVLDVNGMLRRLLGPKIAVETRLDPDLHEVKADPGGLEQVLMNLCVNARDAIDGAGTISIETRNLSFRHGVQPPDPELRPGDYVSVAVRDTGPGIPEDVLPRIFEPFFTTKPVGSGTGLGLATAYGIVKQSGGALTVASEPGATTFTVLLPRTLERAALEAVESEPPPGGGERVLLVEDEEVVRELTRDLLESFGYSVIDVGRAEDAAAIVEHYDLLVSDVVMPGRSGVELASQLTAARPGLRVLLVSGHSTEDMRLLEGNRRWRYLPKPFTPHDLAREVRSLLDAPVALPLAG